MRSTLSTFTKQTMGRVRRRASTKQRSMTCCPPVEEDQLLRRAEEQRENARKMIKLAREIRDQAVEMRKTRAAKKKPT